MDIESKIAALKLKFQINPKIPIKEIEHEVRALMALGVRCRRLRDEVGLGNYAIYKIRKQSGLARKSRPHAKLREVNLINPMAVTPAPARPEITFSLWREKGGIKICVDRSEIAAILKGVL